MAKLSAQESVLLMRLVVKSHNMVKGRSIDFARMAFPEVKGGSDRQYHAFAKEMKDYESALRRQLAKMLVDNDLIEPISDYDLTQMK